jgi:hypothetical protein
MISVPAPPRNKHTRAPDRCGRKAGFQFLDGPGLLEAAGLFAVLWKLRHY